MSLTSSPSSAYSSTRASAFKVKRIWPAVLMIFLVSGVVGFLGTPAGRKAMGLKPSHEALVKEVKATADEIRKQLPKDVGGGVRWDGVEASGTTLTYLYTNTAQADPQRMTYLQDAVRTEVKAALCGTTELRPLLDNDVMLTMRLRDSLGREMGSVDVSRDLCGQR
jgi:hypothetical protein